MNLIFIIKNLSYFINVKIDIFIPENLIAYIDKYNSSNGYYSVIYYTTTSDSSTDIYSIKWYKKEFINKNKAIYQQNLHFLGV